VQRERNTIIKKYQNGHTSAIEKNLVEKVESRQKKREKKRVGITVRWTGPGV